MKKFIYSIWEKLFSPKNDGDKIDFICSRLNPYNMRNRWYTYKEIIDIFGIHKQTLYNWRNEGTIQYKEITRKTFLYKLPRGKRYKNLVYKRVKEAILKEEGGII